MKRTRVQIPVLPLLGSLARILICSRSAISWIILCSDPNYYQSQDIFIVGGKVVEQVVLWPHSSRIFCSIISSGYLYAFPTSAWASSRFPSFSQNHADRCTGYAKLTLVVNVCMLTFDGLAWDGTSIPSHPSSPVLLGSTMTLIRINQLLKMNE